MSNIIISPQSGIIEFNTGIAGSDSLMTSTAPIRLDATGGDIWFTGSNVGIGTTDPQFTLDVEGAIHGTSGNFSTAITVGGNPVMTGESPEADTLQTVTERGATSNQAISVSNVVTSNQFNVGNEGKIKSTSTLGLQLLSSTNKDIIFAPNNGSTERMRIKASGDVGIGTTEPSANGSKTTLHINSDTNGAAIRLSQASNSSLIRYDNTNGLQVGTIASKNLSFETADTKAITIDTSQNVGIGTTGPDSRLHVVGSADSDAASFGSEIVASQTASGTNWSGSSIATGYTHTAGSADVLLSTLNATTNKLYRVEIETTNVTAGRLDKVSFGGIETTVYITNNQTRVLSVKAISTGPLTFECQSGFVGTVTVSSVKEIVASDSLSVLTNSGGGRLETRVFGTADFFLGDSAGENRVSSSNNIGIGNLALQRIATAGINLAIGNRSLSNLTNGSYNVAIGHDILGNYQKNGNVYNIGLGNNVMDGSSMTGQNNIMMGFWAGANMTSASHSLGIGYSVFANLTSGSHNIALGEYSLRNATSGSSNIALGNYALQSLTTTSSNIAIGRLAGRYAIGNAANETPSQSIYIGYNTKAAANGETNQIVIGYSAEGIGANTVTLGNDSVVTTALKGNVGIGTTGPAAKLHVDSSDSEAIRIEADNDPFVRFVENGTNRGFIQYTSTDAFIQKEASGPFHFRIGSTNKVTIADNGKVGIGTVAPNHTLDVEAGTDDIVASFNSLDNKAAIGIYDDDTQIYLSAENSKGSFGFQVGTHANNLNIDTSGNVGIGTNSPAQKLHVKGTALRLEEAGASARHLDIVPAVSGSNHRFTSTTTGSGFNFEYWNGSAATLMAEISSSGLTVSSGSIVLSGTGRIQGIDTVTDSTDAANKAYVDAQVGSADTLQEVTDNGNTTTNNIGIGTTSPDKLLHLEKSSSTSGEELLRLENPNTDGKLTKIGFITSGLIQPQTQIFGGNDNSGQGGQAGNSGAGKFKVTISNPSGTHQEVIYAQNDSSTANKYTSLSSGGSEIIRLKADGNVGIGTTSPNEKLEVDGNIRLTDYTDDIQFGGTANMLSYNQWQASASGGMIIKNAASASTGHIAFETSQGEKVRILRDGNVGIGTTSPSEKLDIRGGDLQIYNSYASGVQIKMAHYDPAAGTTYDSSIIKSVLDAISPQDAGSSMLRFYTNKNSTTNSAVALDLTKDKNAIFYGNVGVGITDPDTELEVGGTIKASTHADAIVIGSPTTVKWKMGVYGANDLLIRDPNNNTKFSILSGGNVGIGVTGPEQKLHVANGSALLSSTSDHQRLYIRSTSSHQSIIYFGDSDNAAQGRVAYNNSSDQMYFNTLGSTKMTILSGGNVGIGTNNPSQELEVGGTVLANDYRGSSHIYLTSPDSWIFRSTAGTERMKVDSAGSLLLGNTTAYQRVIFDPTPSTVLGNGSLTITPSTAPGSGISQFYTRFLDRTAGGTTKHNVIVDGNVGIGTTSPSSKLHVDGTVQVGENDTGYIVKFYGDDSGEYMEWDASNARLNILHTDEGAGLQIFTNGSAQTTQPQIKIGRNNNEYWGVYTEDRNAHLVHRQDETSGNMTTRFDQWDSNTSDNNGSWLWRVGNGSGASMATAMTLTQAGDLTLGGSLTLGGTGRIQGVDTVSASTDAANKAYVDAQVGASDTLQEVTDNGNTTTNSIGIGTTSPSTKLHIDDNATTGTGLLVTGGGVGGPLATFTRDVGGSGTIAINASDSRPQIKLAASSNTFALGVNGSTFEIADNFKLGTNPRLSITNTGNVGIGITNPSRKLEVAGNVGLTGSNTYIFGGDDEILAGQDGNGYYFATGNGQNVNKPVNIGDNNSYIRFNSGNSERLRITSAGNVGIGTTSPASLLNVVASGNGSTALTVEDNARKIKIGRDSIQVSDLSDTYTTLYLNGGGGNVSVPVSSFTVGATGPDSGVKLQVTGHSKFKGDSYHSHINYGSSQDTYIRGGKAGSLVYINDLGTSNVGMVAGGGNVGIGINSPTQKLQVAGNALLANGSADVNLYLGNTSYGLNLDYSAGDIFVRTNGANRLVVKNSGNVGIGTTSPSYPLEISNSGTVPIAYERTGTSAKMGFHIDSANTYWQNITDGVMGLTVSNAGRIGIGTLSPQAKLQVSTADQNTFALAIGNDSYTGGSPRHELLMLNNGTLKWYLPDNGSTPSKFQFYSRDTASYPFTIDSDTANVGIGTTSPDSKLQVKSSGSNIDEITLVHSGNTVKIAALGQESSHGSLYLRHNNGVAKVRLSAGGNSSYILDSNVGIGITSPAYKLDVSGGIRAGGKVTYHKSAGSLTTTGYAVAGLTSFPLGNGASAGFTFTCFGHLGDYQKIVYGCYNSSGTWNTQKVIDEGTNDFDVTASANGSTITFTFKSRSGTKSYTPRVSVEAFGSSINDTYA